MDGLSSAASGLAVVSIAIQLADGLFKLHSFFESLKSASADVASISHDLRVLSEVVRRLQPQEPAYRAVLDSVKEKVRNLELLIADVASGFQSARRRDRQWSAFKVVKAGATLKKFRWSLDETKSTLMLGLQGMTLANAVAPDDITALSTKLTTVEVNAMRKLDDLQGSVAELTNRLAAHNITISFTADLSQHKHDVAQNVQIVAAQLPMALRNAGLVTDINNAVDAQFDQVNRAENRAQPPHDPAASVDTRSSSTPVSRQHSISNASANSPLSIPKARSSQANVLSNRPAVRSWGVPTVSDRKLMMRTQLEVNILFGTIFMVTEQWQRRKLKDDKANKASYTAITEMRTELRFHPAPWLLQCGWDYGFVFGNIQEQSRPKYSLEPFRAVPDNALVFDFAYSGNLDALQAVFDKGLASVLDTDSRGWTPLAWAAYGMHAPTVKYLLDHNSNKDAKVRSHRDKEQLNEYGILELASGTRGIEHGGKPMGHKLTSSAEPVELFGPWADDVSFDVDGSGWTLLISLIGSSTKKLSLNALAPAVSWALQIYYPEIRRGTEKRPRHFEDMIHRALWAGRSDIISAIWNDLGPPDSLPSFDGYGGLHRLICRLAGEVHEHQVQDIADAVRELLDQGYDPHPVGKEEMYSSTWETPLSCAMYSAGSFWHWKNILHLNQINVPDYIDGELLQQCRLVDEGWDKEGLQALFSFPLAPSFFNERSTCSQCRANFFFSPDRWWSKVLSSCRQHAPIDEVWYDVDRDWKPMSDWTFAVERDYFKGWIQLVTVEQIPLATLRKDSVLSNGLVDSENNATKVSGRLVDNAISDSTTLPKPMPDIILGGDSAEYESMIWSYRPVEDQKCRLHRQATDSATS